MHDRVVGIMLGDDLEQVLLGGRRKVSTRADWTPCETARRNSGDLPWGMAMRTSGMGDLEKSLTLPRQLGGDGEYDKRQCFVVAVRIFQLAKMTGYQRRGRTSRRGVRWAEQDAADDQPPGPRHGTGRRARPIG